MFELIGYAIQYISGPETNKYWGKNGKGEWCVSQYPCILEYAETLKQQNKESFETKIVEIYAKR